MNNTKGETMGTQTKGKRLWTIEVVLKKDVDSDVGTRFVVRGDTASHAKEQLSNRQIVQYTRSSRPYQNESDRDYQRI